MAGRVSATGALYLIDGVNLYTVNTTTAAVTLVGPAFEDGLAPTGSGATLYSTDDDSTASTRFPWTDAADLSGDDRR